MSYPLKNNLKKKLAPLTAWDFNTHMKRNELLAEAKQNWNNARSAMAAAKSGSKAWMKAADDVEFWSGKMAAYECYQDWCE